MYVVPGAPGGQAMQCGNKARVGPAPTHLLTIPLARSAPTGFVCLKIKVSLQWVRTHCFTGAATPEPKHQLALPLLKMFFMGFLTGGKPDNIEEPEMPPPHP